MQPHRVAITGVGLLNACGNDAEAVWKSCVEGRSGIGPITRFDATLLPTRIAGEVKTGAATSCSRMQFSASTSGPAPPPSR